MECFSPTDERDATVFKAFLRVHNTAISCGDLEVATEYRTLLESMRSDICRNCKDLSRTTPSRSTNDEGNAPGSHDSLLVSSSARVVKPLSFALFTHPQPGTGNYR
jgi:hypothetical protein